MTLDLLSITAWPNEARRWERCQGRSGDFSSGREADSREKTCANEVDAGIDREEAMKYIGCALPVEILDMIKHGGQYVGPCTCKTLQAYPSCRGKMVTRSNKAGEADRPTVALFLGSGKIKVYHTRIAWCWPSAYPRRYAAEVGRCLIA